LEESLAPLFDGVDLPALIDHQVKFFSHVLGGPTEYDGRSLDVAYRGLDISADQYSILARILTTNIRDMGMDDHDVKIVVDNIQSAKGQIVQNG